MNRKLAPAINKIEKINISLPVKHNLDNGIPVYIVSSGLQEVVKIEFIFNAGSWNQPYPLVAGFTNDMLTDGTESYTAEQIADLLDFYSVFIDKDCDRDKATVNISCLNKHLESVMPVMQEIIMKPVFPQKEFSLMVQNKRQNFILNNEKVKYIAKQKFKELIYGDSHPYGINTKLEDFDNLNTDGLKAFHKNDYSSSSCWIMVSGKPDKNILSILNKYFGKPFSALNSQLSDNKTEQLSTINDKLEFISRPNAVQSAVRIGKVLFNYTHPDYYNAKILNTIFGGYLGSRLMTNIREDKGYTYGINSNIISLKRSGYFFIASQFSVHSSQFLKEIFKEMKRLQDEKVPESELNLVKNYMQGNFLRSIDGPFAYAEMCKIMIEYELENDYFSRYIEKIQNITSDEIQETAVKYLQPESMYQVIVGKK